MNRFIRSSLFLAAAIVFSGIFSNNQTVFAQGAGCTVCISEFRTIGPSGAADEFVEIYNNTDSNIDISAFTLRGSNDTGGTTTRATVIGAAGSNTTVLPARGHYLFVGSTYSLNPPVPGNQTYGTGIINAGGVAIFDAGGISRDQVGLSSGSAFKEGTTLTPVTTTPPSGVQISFVRRIVSGRPQDTGNNSSDFILVSTNGNTTFAAALLGAPGPENLSSHIVRNSTIKSRLLASTLASTAAPNRERTGTGNSGTISFRRTLINNTGQPITSFRFRVNDLSTFGNEVSTSSARLTLTDSVVVTFDLDNDPSTPDTVAEDTTLEQPPAQPSGGGINSSLRVNLSEPVEPSATFSVNITFNILRGGSYRFSLNHEALLGETVVTSLMTRASAGKSK